MRSFNPYYQRSHALVVGIDAYPRSPLQHARHDAEQVAATLKDRFAFAPDDVTLLMDKDATREAILGAYLGFADDGVQPDDRVFIFYAGHGHTVGGNRGPVGYLIPVDGDSARLSTLIGWDELTRGADLIPAKHILFVMDACYGGLAIRRQLAPGSSRYLRDMLKRHSRQAISGGKGDETVADGDGPRRGHSLFTGHLLDALEGGSADADGINTANSVMAYVYDRVGKDPRSRQTPHFGFVDGDGDFVFHGPDLFVAPAESAVGTDILLSPTAITAASTSVMDAPSLSDQVKSLLANPNDRIRLDDLINLTLRMALSELHPDKFPVHPSTDPKAEFAERLDRYERAMESVMQLVTLLGRWATPEQRTLLVKIISHLTSANMRQDGITIWLGLRWYPSLLAMYCGGIAAIHGEDYPNLATMLLAPMSVAQTGGEPVPAIVAVVDGILDVNRSEMFKTLPGRERQFTPASEYLFTRLQPALDDLLFLGRTYEQTFDRFEMLWALVCADVKTKAGSRPWGPPGRFAWKHRDSLQSPIALLVQEAKRAGAKWPPLQAGLVEGSIDRFLALTESYRVELLDKLPWW